MANVVRAFLDGDKSGKAMEMWDASQTNKGFFLNMRVRDPEYLLMPASVFSADTDGHSKDVRDLARLLEKWSTSGKARTPAA